jgi:hypothetical protein
MIIENFINMLMFIAKKDKNEKITYSMINPKKLTKEESDNFKSYTIFIITKRISREISHIDFLNINSENKFLFTNNT